MAAFEDRTSPDLEKFKGGRWTDWLGAIQSSEPKQQAIPEHTSKRNVEVARLRRRDMGLFGYRPATDKFYLVVCEHCGHLVKPQSLNIHYERKHTRKRITRLTPSSLTRASHSQSKNTIDKPNHRILPPPPVLKHGASSSHQKTSHVVLSSERSSNIAKSEPIPEKAAASSERERRHANSNNSRDHRMEKTGTKLIAPQPVKSLNSALHDNPSTQVRPHHSSKKVIHKPGGTIQLTEIPESHVKATSRHSLESSAKHYHRHHRAGSNSSQPQEGDIMHSMEHKKTENKTLSDTHVPGSKSRKNHDSYHHHHHQTSNRESFSCINPLSPENVKILSSRSPLVVLEKTHVAGSVNIGRAHKRGRLLSGSSESSVSPPRHKVLALHTLVDAKGTTKPSKASEIVPKLVVPAKVKKKEKKILPLKAREYDPNKHCGVWVKDENAHCRRSLTCKVHPLSAKRAVTGRRKQFGELIQEHGREKQRLKEKAAASPVVPAPPPLAQAIRSPSAPSPIQFAVPSPAPKATPLSPPPCTKVSAPTSQLLATTASKAKSSISLFPRIFGAWHVDCWDNEEVSEDAASPKLQNNCTCIQRHPQPFTVLDFQSRLSGTCQVSYERRVERQLEALSTNFQKFGSKPTKSPKPFSFTPISGTTYLSAHSSITNANATAHVPQVTVTAKNNSFLNQSQRAPSNTLHLVAPQNVPGVAQTDTQNNGIPIRKLSQKASKNNLSRKLSNLAPSDGPGNQVRQSKVGAMMRNRSRSEQVSNLLKRTVSNVGYVTHANELHSTSPLFILNDSSQETDHPPMQVPLSLVSNVANVNPPVVALRAAMQSGEDRKCSATNSAKLKSKSAIAKFSSITQAQTEARHAEHGSPIAVQLPNGLNSLSRSVLLKPGLHSVTLSGNIGALTVTGDDSNFSGSKVSKRLNSSNSFIVQGEGISPNPLGVKSKQFIQPKLGQAAITRANQPQGGTIFENFLQNDAHFLLDQQSSESVPVLNTENLNQQYAIQNSSYSDPVTLEHQGQANSSTTANILRVLCTPTDNCDTLQVNHNPQLANTNQIDASVLERVFGNQSTHIRHSRLSVDATQGCSTSNPARTPDLGQNFITR